jgi:hypothetical protein
MSLDELIGRLSPSERARIASDLANLERSGDVWDPKAEVFRSLSIGKRTAKFLEQVVDELRSR